MNPQEEMEQLRSNMRNLAAQLSVGWDLEPFPDEIYIAYGQAFKEAARRILVVLGES